MRLWCGKTCREKLCFFLFWWHCPLPWLLEKGYHETSCIFQDFWRLVRVSFGVFLPSQVGADWGPRSWGNPFFRLESGAIMISNIGSRYVWLYVDSNSSLWRNDIQEPRASSTVNGMIRHFRSCGMFDRLERTFGKNIGNKPTSATNTMPPHGQSRSHQGLHGAVAGCFRSKRDDLGGSMAGEE